MTFIERVSLRIAAVGWLSATVAMIASLTDGSIAVSDRWAGLVVLSASVLAVGAAVFTGRFRTLARINF